MTTRRELVEGIGIDGCLAGGPESTRRLVEARARGAPERILPRALEPGMTVGLVAPASHLFEPEAYRTAEDVVRSLGLEPRLAPHARAQHGYLAGRDRERAGDLDAMFADDGVHAVWCLRGGYGTLRLLHLVNYETVRAHPKPFIGYSDITALHLSIHKLTGLVTFHGPMPGSELGEHAVEELRRVLFRPEPAGRVGAPPPFSPGPGRVERTNRVVTLRGGRARGPLVGGNLSLLTRLLGTPFEPELEGRILFVEDVGEATYRIDGMLSQLRLSGKLGVVAGIAFGKLSDGEGEGQPVRLPTETVLRDLTVDLGVPVLWGLMCGHVPDQTTLPYGIEAELDADAGTLSLLEPAVR